MMYVFWWSGRGYLTVVILVAMLATFGLLLQAGRSFIPEALWFWGLGILAAAAVNWHVGSKLNRRKLASLRPASTRARLFYRARHRFMSLPMETFSIVLVLLGLGVTVSSFL